jgi:hypothetical protein
MAVFWAMMMMMMEAIQTSEKSVKSYRGENLKTHILIFIRRSLMVLNKKYIFKC